MPDAQVATNSKTENSNSHHGLQPIERLKGRENYASWKFAMKAYLEMEDLWGCVEEIPANVADPRKMTRARTKIALSLEPVNYGHVEDSRTPKKSWDKLRATFDDAGLSRRVNLLKQLTSISLENSASVEDYINKIIGAAHKLRGVGFTVQEEWLGTLLLAGLSDEYKPMIMAIESSGLPITADSIKTKLLQEVKDPKENKTSQSALYSRGLNTRRKFGPRCYKCKKVGHWANNCRSEKGENNSANNHHRNDNRNYNNNHHNNGNNSGHGHNNGNNNNNNDRRVMFALCAAKSITNADWVIDSGASSHISPQREVFRNFRQQAAVGIVTADETVLEADGIGDIEVPVCMNGEPTTLLVRDVLYVPRAATNLLSINNNDNQVIAIAKETCGIYKLDVDRQIVYHVSQSTTTDDGILWHRRLGHLNRGYMKLLKNVLATGVEYDERTIINPCDDCVKGKQHREPFQPSHRRSRKNQVAKKLKEFIGFYERQTGEKVKTLRTDNGTEYVNNDLGEYLTKAGIQHQKTVAYTPQQNGVAERYNRTVVEKARSILVDAKLPKEYWAEAYEDVGEDERNDTIQEELRIDPQSEVEGSEDEDAYQLAEDDHSSDPETSEEALKSPESKEWLEAMMNEKKSLIDNKTFQVVNRLSNQKLLDTKWVFKTKKNSSGEIERYKARLVIRG
ncbi:uncharacterized protein LOC107046765, partial [Diachasma alloeum]|uniref:uncharacterized protein LOC107046765 n=1 Tax=Diachasma alloeum TaxID=454923 RepID=UPI0007382E13